MFVEICFGGGGIVGLIPSKKSYTSFLNEKELLIGMNFINLYLELRSLVVVNSYQRYFSTLSALNILGTHSFKNNEQKYKFKKYYFLSCTLWTMNMTKKENFVWILNNFKKSNDFKIISKISMFLSIDLLLQFQ